MMPDNKRLTFFLVTFALFNDMAVYSLIIPVLPLYASGIGLNDVDIGFIYGIDALAMLLLSIPFGMLSDRIGRKPVLMTGVLLLMLSTMLFSVSRTLGFLILARLIEGVSSAATWSAGLALLADTLNREERGARLGISMSVAALATILAPVAGGLLYERLSYTLAFVAPSVMIALSAILLLAAPLKAVEPKVIKFGHLLPGKKVLSTIIACAAVTVGGSATYGVIEPYIPVYLSEQFAASSSIIGVVFGTFALMSMLALPLAGRLYDRYAGKIVISGGMILSGLAVACFISSDSLLLMTAFFALLGITISMALMPILPMIYELYTGNGKNGFGGIAYGIYNMLYSAGLMLGPFTGGLAISRLGLNIMLYCYAALLVVAGMVAYLLITETKRVSC